MTKCRSDKNCIDDKKHRVSFFCHIAFCFPYDLLFQVDQMEMLSNACEIRVQADLD